MTNKARAKANINYWRQSDMHELYHAYNSASTAKWRAWDYCKELCNKYNGHNLKIISKNSFVFTAGFEFIDPENGNLKFMYITPNYDTAVDM